jgi:hypothetical protein
MQLATYPEVIVAYCCFCVSCKHWSNCLSLLYTLFAAEHLLAFKAAVADPSAALASWRQGSNPCGAEPWQGVSCTDGWVTTIRLQGQSLHGPLTAGLVKLANLHELYLDNNQLTGRLQRAWQDISTTCVLQLS